jgi:hypothetical protein
MNALLLMAALTAGAQEQPAEAGPHVAGKWLIVYAEEGGRRNNSWEQRQATIKHNTLTYEANGKEHSVQLKFGPNQTVTATSSEGNAHQGVYIAGHDYLCISLESGTLSGAAGGEGKQGAEGGRRGEGHSSGSFILILRHQRSGPGRATGASEK